MKDTEILNWEKSGSYIRSDKGMDVFVKQVGNENASVESTLLLLHGFPESSFSYHLVLDGLQKQFERIILLDLPGYGLSDKPSTGYSYSLLEQADVVLEVWKHFGVTGGHMLSHDMGDSVATELVAREVEGSLPYWFSYGFQSYTFTNGSMVLEFAELRVMQKLLLTSVGKYITWLSNSWVFSHQIKSAQGDAELSDKEVNGLWQLNEHKNGHRITHLTIKYILDRKRYEAKRWLPALSKTEIPIHICWGDKDQVARVDMAYHLKEKVCSKAQLTIMKNVGHFCQSGSPNVWLENVLPFYDKLISSK
jgi:pimeloyl-ACP methyl ester carboxylesterase